MNQRTDDQSGHNEPTALLKSEKATLVDQVIDDILSRAAETEADARAAAVEIIDLGTALIAEFAGTEEFEEAKSVIRARIDTKLATLAKLTENRARDLAREFAMGAILAARSFVIGKVAP